MDNKAAVEKKKGVLIVGSANMDMVVRTKDFPHPGETVLGKSFQMFSGGKGANQAVASSRLGSRTYFIGRLGSDIFKDRLFETMRNDRVDLSGCVIDPESPTGIALISVDEKGENQIVVVSGSNMKLSCEDIETSRGLFEQVNVVLAQLEIPIVTVEKAALMAKEYGCTFILNPAPAPVEKLSDELLRLTGFITPNKGELERMTGIKVSSEEDVQRASEKLIEKGVRNVIVTLGSEGALYSSSEGQTIKLKAKAVDRVVDTTGAGDAFNGALASGLSEGYGIKQAIDLANLAASISVQKMGAQSSMASLDELLELQQQQLQKNKNKPHQS